MYNFFFNRILRNITRYIYKYSHSSSYKHNRRYWPFYKVIRNDQGHIEKVFFKQKLIADHTTHIGSKHKSCMLIATGPSVQAMPPHAFTSTEIDYIGVNGAIAREGIVFKHYIIIDHNFIMNRFDLVLLLLKTNCTFFTTIRCMDEILRRIDADEIDCKVYIIEIIMKAKNERLLQKIELINSASPNYHFKDNIGFSLNINDAVFDYYTVAYAALQVIYALNYENVYIAGLDMTHFNQPRFYENSQNKQPTGLDQNLDAILPAFNTACCVFADSNRNVYNLSKDSLIESFPKIDCDQIEALKQHEQPFKA